MRVLVVDDERHLVRPIEVNLRRQGHAVMCAYDGLQAVCLLEREAFDLAVIDGEMSELLAWMRENESTKDLRVFVFDKGRHDDNPPGPTAGANLWLTQRSDLAGIFER